MTIQIFKNLLEYKKRHEFMNNNPFLNAYLQNGLEAVQDLLLTNGESFDEIDNAARWAAQTNDDQLIDVFAKTEEGCFAKKGALGWFIRNNREDLFLRFVPADLPEDTREQLASHCLASHFGRAFEKLYPEKDGQRQFLRLIAQWGKIDLFDRLTQGISVNYDFFLSVALARYNKDFLFLYIGAGAKKYNLFQVI